jgi:hypothetical protein
MVPAKSVAAAASAVRCARIPDGYVAVPVHRTDESPLRLCVLARQTPDPTAGHFVILRDLHDARVFVGCVTDAGGRLREWVELWVQNVDGLDGSLPAYRETFSNDALDQRWKDFSDALAGVAPESFLQTGWETKHPRPTFLDLSKVAPTFPGDGEDRWELCQDDRALREAGLPPYTTSLFRYLYQPGKGNSTGFIPTVVDAPENAVTTALSSATANHHLAFNAQAGLLAAMTLAPIAYDDYADLLGGKPWKGIEHGKKTIGFGGVYGRLGDWQEIQQAGAHLFLGAQGRTGRIIETFHLKLQLFTEALRLARAFVQRAQLPFLNLAADSFRVKLEDVPSKLPYLWTARCALVKPSHAYALPIEAGEFRHFIRARVPGTSAYLPEGLSNSLQGSGSVRLRKVMPPDQGRTSVEGTLVLQEKVSASPHDLLWIRLPLPGARVDLYGHLYQTESLAHGEARFRTIPQKLPEAVVKALTSSEGVSFARSPFEIVPLLSTPCDLYALAVLAVRTFLVNEQTSLALSLDEMLSLARQIGAEHRADAPLSRRVAELMSKDARFGESLGPHRLIREQAKPEEIYKIIPPELWHSLLAAIVRMFPGLGPDSVAKDFGDAPALALESVFDAPLAELEELLVRSRSLIVIDWTYNREVSAAIEEFVGKT